MKIDNIPEEIINEYKLQEIANKQGMVCIEVTKGMYGLPQARLLANKLFEQCLNKHGHFQSKLVPGLWKHTTRPISLTHVVDNFGIKYVGKEHAEGMVQAWVAQKLVKRDIVQVFTLALGPRFHKNCDILEVVYYNFKLLY